MALRNLIAETREAVNESRPRWPGETGLPKTKSGGTLRAISMRLKGLGGAHIGKLIDKMDYAGAIKEISQMIADMERAGKLQNTAELRDMVKALRAMG